MLKQARKIARDSLFSGFLLTVIIVVAAAGGLLENMERWLYDKRVATCQFFTPPPTDKLVHLDIDDSVLESIGAWPWHRAILADMFDELRIAGPKVVATDVLFSEPQDVRFTPREDGTFERVEDDRLFAESIRKLGCVIVPMSLPFEAPPKLEPIQQQLREELRVDPELTDAQLVEILASKNLARLPAIQTAVARDFLPARREQIYFLIRQALTTAPASAQELRPRILRKSEDNLTTAARRVFEEEYEHASAELSLRKFEPQIPLGLPSLLRSESTIPPIPALAQVAAGTAFFDYPTEKDGKVRRVPLFMEHNGRMVPQIGLSLAAAMLGAKTDQLTASAERVEIPCADAAPVVLPVYTLYSDTMKRHIPIMFDIPWFGSSNWETMYEKVGGAHRSLNMLWSIHETRQKIVKDNFGAFKALQTAYAAYDHDKLDALNKSPPDFENPNARIAEMASVLNEYHDQFEAAEHPDPTIPFKDLQEKQDTEDFAAAGLRLAHAVIEIPKLNQQLAQQRAFVRQQIHDKAVLIGWAATASVADMVPTSLHPKCPGVVIHGTIFNAIMTGRFLTRVSAWVDLVITALFGLTTTVLASRLSPSRAFAYALLIAVLYTLFNGIFLYDYFRSIVILAGPLVVIGVVWAGCTLGRLLAESIQRAHITRQFRSYVDPTLVNYFVENPDSVRLTGEKRELTVCFTDLEGFTTLTEQLGEAAVPLLNSFMEMAVPIIRQHGGYVNKFLGDGIMFFFGAPRHMPDHAARALDTVLALKSAMVQFNRQSFEKNLPPLGLRAGVSSGEMVVGDAGSREASDYTVLGPAVNLGARLESGNKYVGTRNLVNRRAIELAGSAFLARPIGNIRFVGTLSGVLTYEVLAKIDGADATQRRLAELSRAVVEAYNRGNAPACVAAIDQMEAECGRDKFTSLFRDLYENKLKPAANGPFDPVIVLTEK